MAAAATSAPEVSPQISAGGPPTSNGSATGPKTSPVWPQHHSPEVSSRPQAPPAKSELHRGGVRTQSPSRRHLPCHPLRRVSNGPSLFDERIEGDTLELIRKAIGGNCTRCKLHKGRKKIVYGVGNPKAELVFVGEGPGRDEDMQGEPFVGRAGKLLTQMIEAMGLRREDVYICNVVKCRPPENRLPEKDEIATCSPFLMRQLDVIKPKVICCLGSCASQTLLQTTQGISRFRGEWFDFRNKSSSPHTIPHTCSAIPPQKAKSGKISKRSWRSWACSPNPNNPH